MTKPVKPPAVGHDDATARAFIPPGVATILGRRTMTNANRRLKEILRPGMRVLDAGCGTGTITAHAALELGATGTVIGIDPNPALIQAAVGKFDHIQNLTFQVAGIETFVATAPFDLVNTSRVLQWIPDYQKVLERMVTFLRSGGLLHVLDYNHSKLRWEPDAPASVRRFYQTFLRWRADAGMDNEIADRLPAALHAVGLNAVRSTNQDEICRRGDPGFDEGIVLWLDVARYRGPQMVASGYLTETDRLALIGEFEEWVKNAATLQHLSLSSVEGTK